jgi:hypothetical protein
MRKPVFSSPARRDEKATTKQRVLSRAVAAIAAVVDLLCWLCLFTMVSLLLCVCVLAVSGVLLERV